MKNMEYVRFKILNNALELFSSKGYDSVGVQSICENSSITKPTLYYHFGNKAGLLKELFYLYCKELDEKLLAASEYSADIKHYESDVFPVLVKVCKTYFDFAKKNKKFYSLMLSAFYSPDDSEIKNIVNDIIQEQYKIIEKMFNKIADAHINIKRHSNYITFTFIGTINSCIISNQNPDPVDIVHQFMHGIFS